MNSGPEIVSNNSSTAADGVETDVAVHRHWGVQLLSKRTGTVVATRWDPGYGSGVYVPYDEAETRDDLARVDPDYDKRLVTRTETTTTVTTPWGVAE